MVEINPDFIQKIKRIISYENGSPCSIKSFVNNVLSEHFERYEAIIKKRLWKQLKSELAALDRKITAELAPKKEEQDSVENKPASTVEVNTAVVDAPSTSDDRKKTMVAEPKADYKLSGNSRRWAI